MTTMTALDAMQIGLMFVFAYHASTVIDALVLFVCAAATWRPAAREHNTLILSGHSQGER